MFAIAAIHKLRDIRAFKDVLQGYHILPIAGLGIVSVCLPLGELLIAVLLLFMPVAGIAAAGALLSLYALLMAFNIVRGHTQIDCGCFWGSAGDSFPALTWGQVLRNSALVILLVVAYLPTTARTMTIIDILNICAGIGFGYIALKAFFTLMSVKRRMREFGHV